MELPKEDSYLDYEGRTRLFEYRTRSVAGGYVMEAIEKVKNGYRFEAFSETDPYNAFAELRFKIPKALSMRHLHGEAENLAMAHDKLTGYVSYGGVVIDGQFVSFEMLTDLIQAHEGFAFELRLSNLAER